jgi:predicted phage terminase large subunit-like protein
MPILRHLPKGCMDWNKARNEIKLRTEKEAIIDFRSADRPENIEGFGYNLIIINEAGIILKNENLWLESIRPMMLDYKADAIIGGTPKGKKYRGKEHLFYRLYKKESSMQEGVISTSWKSYNYSSYDNPMIEKDEIDELASEISPVLGDQEIYGLFGEEETDRIIKREWFGISSFRSTTDATHFDSSTSSLQRKHSTSTSTLLSAGKVRILQSWDTAFKKNEENDYSVCTTWEVTNNQYLLIDIYRERVEFPELKRKVVELYEKHKPHEIIIEDKASGISLIQELQRETTLPIKAIKVGTDKISRVHSITPIIESGNVKLYTLCNCLNEFLDECEDFPRGEFDDMVDSMSQALAYLRSKVKLKTPKPISRKYNKRKIY